MAATILILPGYGDSGPGHWQTLWERDNGWARVVQDDWENPDLAAWTRRLDEALDRTDGPVVLVAHSLGCALVAHAAEALGSRIAGAFLVAPPDVDEVRHLLPEIETFARMQNVSEDVLRIIGSNRAWLKSYGVVLALTKNPKTPLTLSMGLLSKLQERDVAKVSVDRNVPEALRISARKKVVASASGKG